MEHGKRHPDWEVLEQLSTGKLDEMLNDTLHQSPPDAELFRLIMDILREREKDIRAGITPQIRQAWEQYRQAIGKLDKE